MNASVEPKGKEDTKDTEGNLGFLLFRVARPEPKASAAYVNGTISRLVECIFSGLAD